MSASNTVWQGARRRTEVQGVHRAVRWCVGIENHGHVLHVLEFEVLGVLDVDARGLDPVEEQGGARAVPPDLGHTRGNVEELAAPGSLSCHVLRISARPSAPTPS